MPEQNKPPVTQRAYTLRLRGADPSDTSWRKALWQTHEGVNKGAKAFGDWLLTLRGGLDHALADANEERKARHIKKNEQWVKWDWPLERVWHFLRGTASKNRELLSKIPGFSWKVAGYEKTFQPKAPGKIDRDFHQFYLTHKEGKIYIQPSWSLRAFLRDVYRFFSNAA